MFDILEKLKEIVKNPEMSIPSYGGTANNLLRESTTIMKESAADTSMHSVYSDE